LLDLFEANNLLCQSYRRVICAPEHLDLTVDDVSGFVVLQIGRILLLFVEVVDDVKTGLGGEDVRESFRTRNDISVCRFPVLEGRFWVLRMSAAVLYHDFDELPGAVAGVREAVWAGLGSDSKCMCVVVAINPAVGSGHPGDVG
jgi:hypothetical protein